MSSSSTSTSAPSFVESEVRTPFADSHRKYHAAVFPKAPKGGEAYPAFGGKKFPAPVRMRLDKTVADLSDDGASSSEDEFGDSGRFRKFKKRRHYTARSEERWVLSDRRGPKGSNTLYGEVEGQTARYFILVPPADADGAFRVMPVDKRIKFQKPPNFTPLNGKEVKEIQAAQSSKSKLTEMMERRKQRQEDDQERASKIRDVGDDLGVSDDGSLLQPEDDLAIKARARGSGIPMNNDDDEGGDRDGNEDDIEVMAIDRKGDGRGEGNGDADYEEEFQDDEDDKDVLKEEEDAVANEESLIQGAEEVAEALSDDEDSGSDEDEDGEEEEEEEENNKDLEALLQRRNQAGGLDDEEEEAERARYLANLQSKQQQRTKLINESAADEASRKRESGNKRPMDASTRAVQPARAKAKTPQEAFKESVIEAARQSGGSIDVKKLFKLSMKSKNLKAVGISKGEAGVLLQTVLTKHFDITENEIDGNTSAKLKT